jgi:hypothetical protein
MHISLDSALGRQKRLNSVGESVLQIAPDAAAAYSLRSLTGGDPDVVRVRRESDNTEKDFSGSQIESGEMARWVNEQPTLPLDLRELDTNTGERDGALIEAAAAYSLRNLSSSYTGNVVEVRRSSDDAVQSFTASEVANGTLEDWVNTDVTIYQSNFSSDTNGWSGGTASPVGNQDGVSDGTTSKDNVLKLTKAQDSQAYITRDQGVIAGLTYTVSGSFYAPSSNTGVDGILIKDGIAGSSLSNYPSGYLTSNGVWTDFSFSYTATVSGDQRVNMGISSLGSNPNGSSAGSAGDVVYISDLQFVETTSNGHVKTWYDQSGSDNHAVQTDTAKQPTIVEGGTYLEEVDFDGSQQFQTITLTSSAQPNSVFSVSNTNFAGQTHGIYGTNANQASYYRSSNKHAIYSSGTGAATLEGSAYVVDTDYLQFDLFNGANSVVGVNGTTTSGTTGDAVLNRLDIGDASLGGVNPLNGGIKELILYTDDQSDNRTALEANIGETYGITDIPAANDTVNGFVQTWYDQSGSGNDAEQIAADKQPKIVGEVTSGQPHAFLGGLDFDGVDDELSTSSSFAPDQPITSFIVSNIGNAGSYFSFGASTTDFRFITSSAGLAALNAGTAVTSDVTVTGEETLLTAIGNTTASSIFKNGTSTGSGDIGTAPTGLDEGLKIGNWHIGDRFADGAFKELIIYNSDQSSNRPAIEANINNQYDIY